MQAELDYQTEILELTREIDRLQSTLSKERNRSDRYFATVGDAVKAGIRSLKVSNVTPPVKDRRRKDNETAIVFISDWHIGKATPSYSTATCEERISRLAQKVVEITNIQRLDHPVKHCAIIATGDMIEGELIFPGQAWEVDSSLYRQVTVDGPRILSDLIRTMLANFESVTVYATPGNHGGLGGRSRRDMHPESNADRMLYQIVRMVLEGESRLSWQLADDWYTVADLGDRCRFLCLHGDQVRGWAGIPWYGWARRVLGWASLSRLWPDMTFDHVLAGHFHTPVSMYLNGRRVWINASTESHNPYALEEMSSAGEPAQWLLYVLPGRGVTAEYLVQLGDDYA